MKKNPNVRTAFHSNYSLPKRMKKKHLLDIFVIGNSVIYTLYVQCPKAKHKQNKCIQIIFWHTANLLFKKNPLASKLVISKPFNLKD